MNARTLLLLMTVVACAPFLSARRLDVEDNNDDIVENCQTGQQLALACPPGYISLVDRCYKFHQTARTWTDARTSCGSEGGHLASVMTPAHYTQILAHLNANYAGTYWISGAVVAGNWIWTTEGSPMNPIWWGRNPGSSPNQCAYFCSNTHRYWNKSCNGRIRYICETSKIMKIRKVPSV